MSVSFSVYLLLNILRSELVFTLLQIQRAYIQWMLQMLQVTLKTRLILLLTSVN